MSVSFFTFILPILFHPFHDREMERGRKKLVSVLTTRASYSPPFDASTQASRTAKKNRTHTHTLAHI